LILEASRRGILRRDIPADIHLAGLTLELIEALPDGPLHFTLPMDPRALRAASILRSPEGMCLSLDEIGARSGASKRTLERVFAQETGLTLGRWRKRARIAHALERLANGRPISEVALDAGYASAGAFTVAFRAETGGTPGCYFA
jgi:AraC-like DNA-binding protein